MDPQLRLMSFSVLLLLPFLWFMHMGAKTFRSPEVLTPRMRLGRLALLSGVLLGMWSGLKGTYDPAHWAAGAVIALASVALYEASRRVITGRGFSAAMSGDVPQAVCVEGPYRFVRHPVYTSYLMAFLAMVVAFPSAVTAAVLVANLAFFIHAATAEERVLANSPLAPAYAGYKNRAGMFLPRPGRSAPTSSY